METDASKEPIEFSTFQQKPKFPIDKLTGLDYANLGLTVKNAQGDWKKYIALDGV